MRLAWHIIRKDLARLKWILVLWALVLATGPALALIQSGLNPETFFPFWIAASVVTVGIQPLFAFGLVMGLMHDDPVAEIDAFWITRPISGGELLLAKSLGLLLLALVPVLVALPFWLAHDYAWDQVARAGERTLQVHFLLVVMALPFAMLSANSSHFVGNVMIGGAGLLLLLLLFGLGSSRTDSALVPGLRQTKALLVAWLWIVTGVGVALNQFLRRQTRQSLGAVAVAVVAGCVVAKAWSRPFDFRREAVAESFAVQTRGAREFSAPIEGKLRPVRVVAEVPLHEGAGTSHRGAGLKVQNVFLDYTGELQVAFSAAAPQLSGKISDLLPGAGRVDGPREYYFLTNPGDDRVLPVGPVQSGRDLDVATLRFSHWTIAVRPAAAWPSNPPPDLKVWLMDAVLTKTVAVPAAS